MEVMVRVWDAGRVGGSVCMCLKRLETKRLLCLRVFRAGWFFLLAARGWFGEGVDGDRAQEDKD